MAKEADKEKADKEIFKDPVCNMVVDPEKVDSLVHDGETYYFCSPTCQWAFKNNPEQFIKGKGQKDTASSTEEV